MPDSLKFWLAVAGAIMLNLATVRRLSFVQICVSVSSALMFAVFFTGPALDWWSLPAGTYEPAVAAVMALFGEHVARLILQSDSIAAVVAAIRGKGQ